MRSDPAHHGRPLTEGETAICRAAFGDAVDPAPVRIYARPWWFLQPKRVTMAPDGNIWFHPGGGLYRDDYAAAALHLQGLFVHEMTHVWQHQQGVFLPLARHPFCSYKYDLEPGKPFASYGIEQQAEIVRHAFLLSRGAALKSGARAQDFAGLLPFGAL